MNTTIIILVVIVCVCISISIGGGIGIYFVTQTTTTTTTAAPTTTKTTAAPTTTKATAAPTTTTTTAAPAGTSAPASEKERTINGKENETINFGCPVKSGSISYGKDNKYITYNIPAKITNLVVNNTTMGGDPIPGSAKEFTAKFICSEAKEAAHINIATGKAISCTGYNPKGAGAIYRYIGDKKIRWYSNPDIAGSWDSNFSQFQTVDCTGFTLEKDMPLKRNYSMYKNTDYKNQGDISDKYNTNPEECKIVCDNIQNCSGFVTNGGACFFKSKDVNNPSSLQGYDYYYTGFTPKPLVTCTSDGTWSALTVNVGEVITRGTETARCKADGSWDMSSIPARTYSIIKNTDYKNQGDISEKYNTNPEECKTACNNMENCGGFVTNGNACFFKTKNVTNPSSLQGFDYYKVV